LLARISRLSSIGKLEQHSSVDGQNRSTCPSREDKESLMMLSGLNESRDFVEITEQRMAIKGRGIVTGVSLGAEPEFRS
jgi:hypothetical protein